MAERVEKVCEDDWKRVDMGLLIELYQQEPVLYDVTLTEHRYREVRDEAWSRIASVIGPKFRGLNVNL